MKTRKRSIIDTTMLMTNVNPPSPNSNKMKWIVLLVAFLGVASPFTTAEVGSKLTTPVPPPPPSSGSTSPLFQPRSAISPLASTASSSSASSSDSNKKRSSSIRNFIANLNPSGGKKDGRWKGGESKATVASRLIFSYVSPLLDLASERKLVVDDALEVSESLKMSHSVSTLSEIYDTVQRNTNKRIAAEVAQSSSGISPDIAMKQSRTWILLKALLLSQRKRLIVTAILRLCNTAVQAFPALLVARLLRSIEAGSTYPASKALTAAMALFAVLSLKMITENQFFHNIVTLSTQTRGALEGLIFDKSLRSPGGGSGVISKQGIEKKKKALGSGGVINLMQSDATIIENAAMQVHTIWDGPLQVSSSLFFFKAKFIVRNIFVLAHLTEFLFCLICILLASVFLRLPCTRHCYSNTLVHLFGGDLRFF